MRTKRQTCSRVGSCLVIAAGLVLAQQPEFEVASIQVVDSAARIRRVAVTGGPGTEDPTTWRAENLTLSGLLAHAYDRPIYQIAGPAWISQDPFVVTAKVPPGSTMAELRLMLQRLLEERFQLTFHHENRPSATYQLTVAKSGLKLKVSPTERPAEEPDTTGLRINDDGVLVLPRGRGMTMAAMDGRVAFQYRDRLIADFAHDLANQLQRPVEDQTGLTAKYDIDLHWDSRPAPPPDGILGPNLIQAVREQLGLVLEQKKGTMDVLVVDKATRTPREN